MCSFKLESAPSQGGTFERVDHGTLLCHHYIQRLYGGRSYWGEVWSCKKGPFFWRRESQVSECPKKLVGLGTTFVDERKELLGNKNSVVGLKNVFSPLSLFFYSFFFSLFFFFSFSFSFSFSLSFSFSFFFFFCLFFFFLFFFFFFFFFFSYLFFFSFLLMVFSSFFFSFFFFLLILLHFSFSFLSFLYFLSSFLSFRITYDKWIWKCRL